jgi:hypothetical protein
VPPPTEAGPKVVQEPIGTGSYHCTLALHGAAPMGEDTHMDIEPNLSAESLRFREHYRTLTDDDLVHLGIDQDLIPAAREVITDELEARGLQDLSSFTTPWLVNHA